jgi:succinate dehydrogenase / fumarate reductase cytochrome b subunit
MSRFPVSRGPAECSHVMNWFLRLLKSSIGAKALMAVTGFLLFGFVVAHLLGNLQMFAGQEPVNQYAQTLKDLGPLLWVMRLGLLGVFVLHIFTGLRLAAANRSARPVAYSYSDTVQATLSSRSMVPTGILVLVYVVYHLAHLTWGFILNDYYTLTDDQGRHDVYSMAVLGFQNAWVSLTYVIAMLVLGFHLYHGIPSFFQTLGLKHSRYNDLIARLGPALTGLIVLGYLSIPAGVLAGIIQLPEGVRAP